MFVCLCFCRKIDITISAPTTATTTTSSPTFVWQEKKESSL